LACRFSTGNASCHTEIQRRPSAAWQTGGRSGAGSRQQAASRTWAVVVVVSRSKPAAHAPTHAGVGTDAAVLSTVAGPEQTLWQAQEKQASSDSNPAKTPTLANRRQSKKLKRGRTATCNACDGEEWRRQSRRRHCCCLVGCTRCVSGCSVRRCSRRTCLQPGLPGRWWTVPRPASAWQAGTNSEPSAAKNNAKTKANHSAGVGFARPKCQWLTSVSPAKMLVSSAGV